MLVNYIAFETIQKLSSEFAVVRQQFRVGLLYFMAQIFQPSDSIFPLDFVKVLL